MVVFLASPHPSDESTYLIYLLGLQYAAGIELLCSAGLFKVIDGRNPNATVTVTAGWEKSVVEDQNF